MFCNPRTKYIALDTTKSTNQLTERTDGRNERTLPWYLYYRADGRTKRKNLTLLILLPSGQTDGRKNLTLLILLPSGQTDGRTNEPYPANRTVVAGVHSR